MKIIIVIGGVYSGLGKGIIAASIGKMFPHPTMVKFDGYANVNPGTMRPTEHGECYVLGDGTEVDLDFGHYERFLGSNHTPKSITMGSLMKKVNRIETHASLFEGESLEQVPHLRDVLVDEILCEGQDIILEIGGSVGDAESSVALHAAKALQTRFGRENVATIFVVPVIYSLKGEMKTRPMRRALMDLRMYGLEPDIMVIRSMSVLSESFLAKIHRWSLVKHVLNLPNLSSVYTVPEYLHAQGFYEIVTTQLNLPAFCLDMPWLARVARLQNSPKLASINVVLCGKYDDSADAYLSIREALIHAAAYLNIHVTVKVVSAESETILNDIENAHAIIIPGGYGSRGVNGKMRVLEYARQEDVPCLGICYGMQLMAIEFAQHVLGLQDANSVEIDAKTSEPVVICATHITSGKTLVERTRSETDVIVESDVKERRVTVRSETQHTGNFSVSLIPHTVAWQTYAKCTVVERHRHRYCVNRDYELQFKLHGLRVSGKTENQISILEHEDKTFYVGTQFHPEFNSTLLSPAPLFVGLLQSAMPKF